MPAKYQMENCGRCGRLFMHVHSAVCLGCEADEERDYAKIADVMAEHPGMTAADVAEAAGVPMECVMRMLKAGRVKNTALGDPVQCGRCGKPAISVSKRLCAECLAKLDAECARAIQELRPVQQRRRAVADAHQVRRVVDGKRGRDDQQ